jgi:hypothetical protein
MAARERGSHISREQREIFRLKIEVMDKIDRNFSELISFSS